MAGIHTNVSGLGLSQLGPVRRPGRPSQTPADTAVTTTTSLPTDGAAISFAKAAPAASAAHSTPAEDTTVSRSPAESAFSKAAMQNGVTLAESGALLVLEQAGPTKAPQALGKPFSLRSPDLEALKLPAETVAAQSMVFMNEPSEVKGYFQQLMGDKKVRLATAGYSAPPSGYEEPTKKFLSELASELKGEVGFVTSPTADRGSIDAITSTVGQKAGAPLGYVTADSYLGYVNPENFPSEIDAGKFASQPKFAFPDAEVYSKATAELSNSFLVTGGRNASVSDFKNAIKQGNRVVVLTNEDVSSPAWDPAKNRVDNASSYLQRMLSGDTQGIPMDHAFNQDVSSFLRENRESVLQQVKFVDAKDSGAVSQAAQHLKG